MTLLMSPPRSPSRGAPEMLTQRRKPHSTSLFVWRQWDPSLTQTQLQTSCLPSPHPPVECLLPLLSPIPPVFPLIFDPESPAFLCMWNGWSSWGRNQQLILFTHQGSPLTRIQNPRGPSATASLRATCPVLWESGSDSASLETTSWPSLRTALLQIAETCLANKTAFCQLTGAVLHR